MWLTEIWIPSRICGIHTVAEILICTGIFIDVGRKKKDSPLWQMKCTLVRKKHIYSLVDFDTYKCLQSNHLIKIFWSLSGIVRSIVKLFTDHRKEFSVGITKPQARVTPGLRFLHSCAIASFEGHSFHNNGTWRSLIYTLPLWHIVLFLGTPGRIAHATLHLWHN